MSMTIVATTPDDAQPHEGTRLVIDGLEIPVPAGSTLAFTQDAVEVPVEEAQQHVYAEFTPGDRHVVLTIPLGTVERQPLHTGPTPAQILAFTTAYLETIADIDARIAWQKRRGDLEPNPVKRQINLALCEGMGAAIQRFQALAAQHLLATREVPAEVAP